MFREVGSGDQAYSQRKITVQKPSSTSELLRYDYALPFRDEKVTRKIA